MKQQNTGKSRRGAVCGLLLLLLLLLAAAAAVLPAARGTGEKTTLSVALYPFVPDQARFQQAVEAEWNARHPEVALRFVPWNGYTEDPPDDLDVFVYDSVFLYDFLEKGCLLPIADEEVRDAGDYFPYALDACRVNGVIYALPQLLCTNLLYAREGDSELSEAANVGELYEIVGSSTRTDGPPAEGEGLLVNIPEGMNAAFWYLEVRIDREQQFSEWISFPETDDFDPEVMDVLRTVQEMARGYQKEDFPPEAGWQSYEASFTEGYGRAFIGFSESMYGMGDAADDVVFHRFSLSDGDDIVSRDETYQNAMRYSDKQNARAESDRATSQAILATMSSGVELYREVQSNESFRKWILDMVFNATYNPPVAARSSRPRSNAYVMEPGPTLMVAEPATPYGEGGDNHVR